MIGPDPSAGLTGLIAALQGGMDPGQAFSVAQYLEGQQNAQMQARAQRLSGLSSLLTNAASQGMSYDQANALAQVQPGPAGPAVQNMLSTLYPTASVQPGTQAAINAVQGSYNPAADAMGMQPQAYGPQAPSLMYTQGANSGLDQSVAAAQQAQIQSMQAQTSLAADQAQLQSSQSSAAMEGGWAQFQQIMTQYKAKGIDPTVALQQFVKANPQAAPMLLSSDPGRVKAILTNTFGAQAMAMAGAVAPQG